MIYEENGKYYIDKSGVFMQCDILTRRNTIVLMPNGEFRADITPNKEYTFAELKAKVLGNN